MPAGRKQQNNAMLYTVVVFVGLFIISTTVAVIYYLQAEKHRTEASNLQNQMDDLATPSEMRNIGAVVGTKQPRKSRLGTMVDYLDQTVSLVVGGLPEDTSAEVKVDKANREAKETLALLSRQHTMPENITTEVPDNEVVNLLVDQQFETLTEKFDETMKTELPVEQIRQTWESTITQMGPFKRQAGLRTEEQMDVEITSVTCEFEQGYLDIQIAYNDENQIAGLFIIPTPSDVLESYQQTPSLETTKQSYIKIDDPNTIGLIRVIKKLTTKLDNTTNTALVLQEQFEQMKKQFDDAMQETIEKEKTLLAEKEKYQQQVNEIKQDYNNLKALTQQTANQQVNMLMTQLDEERTARKRLNQQLLKTEAELAIAEERMKRAQEKLHELVPPPDSEIAAYQPDGKIILIDASAKIVHINLGSEDHVYRGLTFSVYDKNMPIPKDGRGKAEIEVFNVGKNISAARIIRSSVKNPIILDDIIANLIWDSDKMNVFVVAGEFDLDNDGTVDYRGAEKIKALIEKWGGKAVDNISINTDFLVLGTTPTVLERPTFEQMEVDPMAMEKYEASLQRLEFYNDVQNRAQLFSIPVFNTERFLYFIGYKTQSVRPGAF
jgi:hypothetical protein